MLLGLMMIAIAPPTAKALFYYAFGAFCLAIAFACVARGRIAEFFGSVVGLSVFTAGVAYVISELTGGELVSPSKSQPSLLNAVFFMFAFGFPAAGYVWHARFGFGRKCPGSRPGAKGANKDTHGS